MKQQKPTEKIYYHVMEGSRFIFADERNKKKFLDVVFEVQRKEGWHIYAFCVTDDSAYFVVEAAGRAAVLAGMRRAAEAFSHMYRQRPQEFGTVLSLQFSAGVTTELKSLPDLAACCRQIHRIPLEEGFVKRLSDYWWSSYITYIGNYDWQMVDCRVLLLYFSADADTAQRRLLQYHQQSGKCCI